MRLGSVEGNTQRLDGGAMFGNCPRVLWERWCPPDDHHRIRLACRALLIQEDSGRSVLLEAGIGAFFDPSLRERFGVEQAQHVLLTSLEARGLRPADVDVVVLSHLHFDHAGGLLSAWQDGAAPALVFPSARYVIGKEAWARAAAPHPRDRASFIPALLPLLEDTGRVELVDGPRSRALGDAYRFTYSHGHTPGLTLTTVDSPSGPITFAADLIPGTPWVHLPITMGYDRFPELLIEEKRALLEQVVGQGGRLFYTHDAETAASRVEVDDRGKFVATDRVATL